MKNSNSKTIDIKEQSTKNELLLQMKKAKEKRIGDAIQNLKNIGLTEEYIEAGRKKGLSSSEILISLKPSTPHTPSPEEEAFDEIIDELLQKTDLLKEKNKEIEQLKNRVKELEAKLAESAPTSRS